MCRVTGNYTHPRTPTARVHTRANPRAHRGPGDLVETVRSGNGENAAYPFVLSRFGRFVGPAIYGWILPACVLLLSLSLVTLARPRPLAADGSVSSPRPCRAAIPAWRDYLFHWVSVTLCGGVRQPSPRGPAYVFSVVSPAKCQEVRIRRCLDVAFNGSRPADGL